MSANYRRFLKILEKWPVDKTKAGRDLGEDLREQLKVLLVREQEPGFSTEEYSKQLDCLSRISNNVHAKSFPRNSRITATGLTGEQCNQVLSSEFLEYMNTKFYQTQYSEDVIVSSSHKPVMVKEVLNNLKPEDNQVILDMTFGAGGHSRHILQTAPNVKLLALDRDPVAYNYAKEMQKEFPENLIPLLGRFSELPKLLNDHGFEQNSIDGMLFDFGCSSMQFDVAERGFSVNKDAALDMRMDGDRFPDMPTAADILAKANEIDLYKIFKIYGEEKYAKKIARALIQARYSVKRIETTRELVDLVSACCQEEFRKDMLQRPTSVATKIFQALRIFVNNELNEINYAMILAQKFIKIGGRLVTLTFHSLEDKIVKRHIFGNVAENMVNALPLKYVSHTMIYDRDIVDTLTNTGWLSLHKHVLTPSQTEIDQNPRSRSAKLRAALRVN